jgi:mannose-6-phosphate isomerase-like protein (cupin superfamily)
MSEYAIGRMEIAAGGTQQLHFFTSPYQAFVESGSVVVRSLDAAGNEHSGVVNSGQALSLPKYFVHGFSSDQGAVVYIFGPHTADRFEALYAESEEAAKASTVLLHAVSMQQLGQPTTDAREKYWGRIETILSGDVAAKRIFVKKGGQSSLEYHVEKCESYYIHSGLLRVGLRTGRAENHSIVMKAGESYDVRPGVMHMRMGLEDTVILEVSTRDSDADSYLVEDGQSYQHMDADFDSATTEELEQPK